jgi:RHS repeat-associated protein
VEYDFGLDRVESEYVHSHGGYVLGGKDEVWASTSTQPGAWEPGSMTRATSNGVVTSLTSESHVWNQGKDSLVQTNVEDSEGYVAADRKLRFYQATRGVKNEFGNWIAGEYSGAFEAYEYDALGRRTMRRTDQPTTLCDRQEWCDGATDWFIWDGDQILWEKHGGLEVGYVHALGIDAPVELIREGEALFTAINWRGLMSQLVDTAGEPVGCTGSNPPPCEDIAFAAGRAGPYLGGDPRKTPEWYGSIVTAQQDASGLMYRRNRYYDPEAGQFTQQDPIGIAGGLNLYGYANGDPINFSDPFGLCPVCAVAWGIFEFGASVYDAVDLAATGVRYLSGSASREELGATALGAAAGVVAFGVAPAAPHESPLGRPRPQRWEGP